MNDELDSFPCIAVLRLQNIEQDIDMLEERELLRLQMDNNSLTQLLSEKEAAIEEIYEAQKAQAKQWIEEREKYLEAYVFVM